MFQYSQIPIKVSFGIWLNAPEIVTEKQSIKTTCQPAVTESSRFPDCGAALIKPRFQNCSVI